MHILGTRYFVLLDATSGAWQLHDASMPLIFPVLFEINQNHQATILKSLFCTCAPLNICVIPWKYPPIGTLWVIVSDLS